MRIGRNDLCPCGSGQKYKKCCLRKNEVAKASADSLRAKIMDFVESEGFMKNYPSAVSQYWKTLDEGVEPRPMSDNDMAGFIEWLIHDYVIPERGRPIISVFLESNPELASEELQILKDWQKTNLSVYQAVRVELNHGVFVEDIFTHEEFFLNDISISKSAKQWQLLVCRKVWVLNQWQVSALATALPPDEKGDIYEFVMGHYRSYLDSHSRQSVSDFLHEKG